MYEGQHFLLVIWKSYIIHNNKTALCFSLFLRPLFGNMILLFYI